jgi:5'-nucleotidase
MNMKSILLTNDDGYSCAGFYPLLDELKKHYDVTAIAPEFQKSATGKSLSVHSPIPFKKVVHEGHDVFAIDGSPADCVQIGLYDLMEKRPDLVVSGINVGANIGNAMMLSSGTIGAAMEGAIDGVVSIAASMIEPKEIEATQTVIDYFNPSSYKYFENAAKIVARLVKLIETIDLPKGIDVISINIPFDAKEDADIAITKPSLHSTGGIYKRDGNAFSYDKWDIKFENMTEGTDLKAIHEGKVAVTPIDLRLATQESVSFLEDNLKPLWQR